MPMQMKTAASKLGVRAIFATILCMMALTVHAQRRNSEGLKMVKTLRTTVIDRWDKQSYPWLNRIYSFEYEPDGSLKKVTRKWIDDGKKNVETLEHSSEGYHYTHLVDGRSNPNLKVKYTPNDLGIIRSVIEDNKESHTTWKRDSIGWTYFRTSTVYSANYKVLTFEFIGDKSKSENWEDGKLKEKLTYGTTKAMPRFDRISADDIRDMGMDGYVLEFVSKDSIGYSIFETSRDFYNLVKGNLMFHKSNYNTTVYLNDKNDINLFLLPLSHTATLQHYYNNIEAVTEWIGFRTKNLIEYEDKNLHGKYYEAHWIYERDADGNIYRIIIEVPSSMACKIILDLEYVM